MKTREYEYMICRAAGIELVRVSARSSDVSDKKAIALVKKRMKSKRVRHYVMYRREPPQNIVGPIGSARFFTASV
jgi:hypothetical protein